MGGTLSAEAPPRHHQGNRKGTRRCPFRSRALSVQMRSTLYGEGGEVRRGRSRLLVVALSAAVCGGTTAYAAAPFVGSTLTYLSDVNVDTFTATNYGPLQKDTSHDGRMITLNRTTYLKGLGAHAPSDLHYALPSNCSRFQASVGIDDEVFPPPKGSVVFQVYADATKVYDSGLMTGTSATQLVNVSIVGADVLELVVTDGGDYNNFDHADWADARIRCETAHSGASSSRTGSSGTTFALPLLGVVSVAGALCAAGLVLRRRERPLEQRKFTSRRP